jgi:hypothetical protein
MTRFEYVGQNTYVVSSSTKKVSQSQVSKVIRVERHKGICASPRLVGFMQTSHETKETWVTWGRTLLNTRRESSCASRVRIR